MCRVYRDVAYQGSQRVYKARGARRAARAGRTWRIGLRQAQWRIRARRAPARRAASGVYKGVCRDVDALGPERACKARGTCAPQTLHALYIVREPRCLCTTMKRSFHGPSHALHIVREPPLP